jgi:radical SAM protein with 4Fe4S-binding SPASM domain
MEKIYMPQFLIIQGTGEPLVDSSFFAKVRLALDKGCSEVQTTTNGILLNADKCNKLYASGLSKIVISVDSPEKKTYEAIRVGARWETLRKNLDSLCSHPERAKLKIELAVIPHPTTLNILPDLIEFAKYFGCDSIFFNFDMIFWGEEGLKNKIADNRIAGLMAFTAYRKLLYKAMEISFPVVIYMPVPDATPYIKNYCDFSINQMSICLDGSVVPCCRARNMQELIMGNIFTERFDSIWNGERFRAFRRAWMVGNPPLICATICYPYHIRERASNGPI